MELEYNTFLLFLLFYFTRLASKVLQFFSLPTTRVSRLRIFINLQKKILFNFAKLQKEGEQRGHKLFKYVPRKKNERKYLKKK